MERMGAVSKERTLEVLKAEVSSACIVHDESAFIDSSSGHSTWKVAAPIDLRCERSVNACLYQLIDVPTRDG